MKKYDNIKSLSITDLQAQINDSEKTLQRLKFSHRLTPLENPMQIRGLRKQIARLYTVLAEKQS